MVSIVVDFLFLFARCHSGIFVIGLIIDMQLFIIFVFKVSATHSFFYTNKRE